LTCNTEIGATYQPLHLFLWWPVSEDINQLMEEKKLCEVSSKLCPYFRRFSETAGRGGGEQMSMASIKLDHIS